MLHQLPTSVTVSGYDVQNAGRQTRIVAHLGKIKCAQARVLSWFQYDGVARRQGGRHFPGQHEQRKIPWHYLSDDTQRLRVGQLAVHQLRPASAVVEVADRKRAVRVARLAHGLAVIHRLHNG